VGNLQLTCRQLYAHTPPPAGKAGNAQSQSLFESYARLQQLRGQAVSIPAGKTTRHRSCLRHVIVLVLYGTREHTACSRVTAAAVPCRWLPVTCFFLIPAGTAATSEQTSRVVGIIEAVVRGSGGEAELRQAMAILQVCVYMLHGSFCIETTGRIVMPYI
jgi:hypothetical protein